MPKHLNKCSFKVVAVARKMIVQDSGLLDKVNGYITVKKSIAYGSFLLVIFIFINVEIKLRNTHICL